jgi:hypothetical protein
MTIARFGLAVAVGIAVTASNPVYFIAVRPEIRNFADLKDKTITIIRTTELPFGRENCCRSMGCRAKPFQ